MQTGPYMQGIIDAAVANENIILTRGGGTGSIYIGHYVGSSSTRENLQISKDV
jgi:hypothetical protein